MTTLNDLPALFTRILAEAKQAFGGTRSAFDYQISTGDRNDPAWRGIWNSIFILACTELKDVLTRDGDPSGRPGEDAYQHPDVIRARRLEELLAPQIAELLADCKGARYTGWSMMHGGPVRRVDGLGRLYYPEESPHPPTAPNSSVAP